MRRSETAFPLRFLALHVAMGFALAALFVAALLLFNGGGLGELLWRVGGIGAVMRLWGGCGLTFGAAMFATAIMSLGSASGLRGAKRPVWVPVPRLAPRVTHPK